MNLNIDKYLILNKIRKGDFDKIIKEAHTKHNIPFLKTVNDNGVYDSVVEAFNSISDELSKNIFFVSEPFFEAVEKSPFCEMNEKSQERSRELLLELYRKPHLGILIYKLNIFFYYIKSPFERYYMILDSRGILVGCLRMDDRTRNLQASITTYTSMLADYYKANVENILPTFMGYYMAILLFKSYAECEVVVINRNSKIKYQNKRFKNQLIINIQLLDCSWFRTIMRIEGFKVRGHFRLQPKKDKNGEWTKSLIYINDFQKHGYTRTARMLTE